MKTFAVVMLVVALLAPGGAGLAWIETEMEEQEVTVEKFGDEWDIGKTVAVSAILCGSVFMLVRLRRADRLVEKAGVLLWTVSLPVFAIMVLWEQFHASTGKSLIGVREDDQILFFSLYGMILGLFLRIGIFPRIVKGVIHLAKASNWRY